MQALKALVIFMGVLIVIMMTVVGYGIVVKFGNVMDRGEAEAPTTPGLPAAAEVWDGNLRVPVAAGAQVAETVVADGRMVVRLVLPDGSQRYLVFDLAAGRQVGAIDLEPGAGGQ